MESVKRLGCCACWQLGQFSPSEVHHLNLGGKAGQKRRGHEFTIPLCPWHHRGDFSAFGSRAIAERLAGPSFALQSRLFRERFGDDEFLLGLTNDALQILRGAN